MELIDHYLIEIDSVYDSGETKSKVIMLNEANMNEEQEDRFIYKRLYGTVVDVPLSFTDTPVSADDEGLPPYTTFIGHDAIAERVRQGFTDWGKQQYKCSTFEEYDKVTMADIGKKMTVKIGDKVYFDEKVTERDNFMGTTGGSALVGGAKPKLVFRCPVNQVFCRVVDGVIEMQNGWVLADPDIESWEDVTTPAGVIRAVPDAKALRAWVRHIGPRKDLTPGDHIIYITNANVSMVVEGKEYFIMMEEEILSKIKH